MPALAEKGVKLFLVSIGTKEGMMTFVEGTKFPAENFFVDPESSIYASLGLVKGLGATFMDMKTPLAIKARMDSGKDQDIKDVMKVYKMLMPPSNDQTTQQGGLYIFQGTSTLFEWEDGATANHADLDKVIQVALSEPLTVA